MSVVVSQAVIERTIKIRQLVDELETDTKELKTLIAQEREEINRGEQ